MSTDEIPAELEAAVSNQVTANLLNLVFMMADAASRSGIDGKALVRHATRAIAARESQDAAHKRAANDLPGAAIVDEARLRFDSLVSQTLGDGAPRH